MKEKHVLIALLAVAAVSSFIDEFTEMRHASMPGTALAITLLGSFLIFWWYRLDSTARQYRRSALLNVGVLGLAVAAVPYYVVRSRPAGRRLKALGALASYVLLLALATGLGMAAAHFFA